MRNLSHVWEEMKRKEEKRRKQERRGEERREEKRREEKRREGGLFYLNTSNCAIFWRCFKIFDLVESLCQLGVTEVRISNV